MAMAAAASSTWQQQRSPLADLPPDLFGRIIALLPLPGDRARFRAVCRSWRSAMHDHVVDTPQLPWIVHSDGTFVTLPNYHLHTWSPFPAENTKLVGATGSWLAVYHTDANNGGPRRYMLHNPFSNTTVPLPGLDSVIGRVVSDEFKVRKVLMRSTQDDLVAVTTNMRDFRIILCRPGKPGAWLLKRRALPHARICDVAFLGDNLYGVTSDEQLVKLEIIGHKEDGRPRVKTAKYVTLKHFLGHQLDEGAEQEVDSEDESQVQGDEDDEPNEAPSLGGEEEALSVDDDDVYDDDDDDDVYDDDEDDDDDDDDNDDDDNMERSGTSSIDDEYTESMSDEESDNDNEVENNLKVVIDLDGYCSNPDDVEENEFMDYTVTKRCLLESDGKLLMIKRRQFITCHSTRPGRELITNSEEGDDDSDVEILVADLQVGSWLPAVTRCIFFIGDHFSKSIHGCGEAYEESDCYFVDEHDITITRAMTFPEFLDWKSMWFSPPELVV
uniref:F-box domain-containing protein n=1 Tax=Hordeum vulgare subsp. vulgare TaxID=112509 RepID=A0A8I7BDF7_HORVV